MSWNNKQKYNVEGWKDKYGRYTKIKRSINKWESNVVFGAGFSYGSKNSYGDMATENVLKNEIYNTFVKGAIKDSYKTEVQQFTL